MDFNGPLLKGKLIKRYKRFLADIQLDDGRLITAHCANSGSMMGLKDEGLAVWVTEVPKESQRKLRYDWHLVQAPHSNERVGINTSHPNRLVAEALEHGKIEPLSAYKTIRPEVKYGSQNSRIDFLLSEKNLPDCYVEVKNVTLKRDDLLQFPDAVTARGKKHLQELILMKEQGHRAVVLYIAQRMDATNFRVAEDIDPEYAVVSLEAKKKGVEFYCYGCGITDIGITIATPLTIQS